MRSVLSGSLLQPNPSARSITRRRFSESMSLYRAGLKLAFFLPLGVAMLPPGSEGFTDVSSVISHPLRDSATL